MKKTRATAPHRKDIILALWGCCVVVLLSVGNVHAQGNLMVLPMRIVFDNNSQLQELNVSNTGKDTSTYTLSLLQYRMQNNGKIEKISKPDSGQHFADKYLRFFPRTITLAPNESQRIMVQVTKKHELIEGEYRSHLYIRSVPKEINREDTSSTFKLIPVYGISIPVIIQNGETRATVKLADVKLVEKEKGQQTATVALMREGNRSVYGDLSIDHISDSGVQTRVSTVKGIAVYSPVTLRTAELPLANGVNYQAGKLEIVYSAQTVSGTEKLATKEVLLNPDK